MKVKTVVAASVHPMNESARQNLPVNKVSGGVRRCLLVRGCQEVTEDARRCQEVSRGVRSCQGV